jgi:hypothetical protein
MNSKEGYKTKKRRKKERTVKKDKQIEKGETKKGTLKKKKQQHFTTLRGYRMLQVFRG